MATGSFQKPYTAADLKKEAKRFFKNVEVIDGVQSGISWTISASDPKITGEGEPETPNRQDKPSTHNKALAQQKAAAMGSQDAADEAEIDEIKHLAGMDKE